MKKSLIMFDCFGVVSCSVLTAWFKKTFNDEQGKELSNYYCGRGDKGELTLSEIATAVSPLCGIEPTALVKFWIDSSFVSEDIKEYIKQLKKNHEVVLASNACEGLVEGVLKKNNIENLFDKIFISYKMKDTKPNLSFYLKILNSYNCSFEKTYMIDDRLNNLKDIETLGITPIHFTSLEELKKILK